MVQSKQSPAEHPTHIPPQQQPTGEPGKEWQMHPLPQTEPLYPGTGKLKDRKALITGGDSGIGRAVAQLFAHEGADLSLVYLSTDRDADETRKLVEKEGSRCLLIKGDVADESFCRQAVEKTAAELGGLDILVNNAGEQHVTKSLEQLSADQLRRTFDTNIFGMFFMSKAALKHLKRGAAIVNTCSVTYIKGDADLVDYAASKGAIFSFTRSLAQQLGDKGIRVNCVAPGPIWTPLIPSSFSSSHVANFGKDTAMGRPGQPNEVAPAYLYLVSQEGSYVTGTVIHVDGGEFRGS